MSGVGTSALKSILQSDFNFFKSWYGFHYSVDSYVDKSSYGAIFEKYPEKIFNIMLASPVKRASIKRAILQCCGLSEEVDYAIDSPVLPFAMLTAKTLSKLQLIVGAMVCFKDINKIIGKRDLDRIFELIGREAYAFIIKRSLLFWKKIPKLSEDFSKVKLIERIPMCGKLVLEYVVSSLPESAIRRMSMRSGIDFARVGSCPQDEVAKAIGFVKYVLVNFFSDSEDAKLCLK
ncbi:MAG: SctK family type III secretion system sorting platform protein [Puniceicoccales bacterium]|jgi:hypothetical protein|nr:SctK family type III secretion system sorting platform protein [Puniceicoccales bacterium]